MTIRDVARQAGVSVATVSRVLNNSGPVSSSTRRRVEAVAEALDYVPHGGARSLITRRTTNLGVILPDLYGEFFSELIRGMDRATRAAGYHLLLSGSHAADVELAAALRAMRGRVDGLILMSPEITPAELVELIPRGLPVVLINTEVGKNGRFDTLNVDNRGGAYAAVQHLVSAGHSRIALINGRLANHDARERRLGYRRALEEAGLESASELELESDFTKAGGQRAARALLELEPRPTAVFAANDSMAVGALSAFREAGLRVPDEMAVVGFDDIPIAEYVTPPLSTVKVDLLRFGERAVELVVDSLTDPSGREPRDEIVETQLVIRRSSDGAPGVAAVAGSAEERQL
ncbi:MAG: LacI family DNA-binding transcriptional regulator [Gemmatimonadota bacterium]